MVVAAPTMRRSEKSLQIWRCCSQHVAQAFCERAVIVLAVALMMGVRALKQEIYEACPTPFRMRRALLRHLRRDVLQTLADSGRPRYAWQRELK